MTAGALVVVVEEVKMLASAVVLTEDSVSLVRVPVDVACVSVVVCAVVEDSDIDVKDDVIAVVVLAVDVACEVVVV